MHQLKGNTFETAIIQQHRRRESNVEEALIRRSDGKAVPQHLYASLKGKSERGNWQLCTCGITKLMVKIVIGKGYETACPCRFIAFCKTILTVLHCTGESNLPA